MDQFSSYFRENALTGEVILIVICSYAVTKNVC